MRKAQIAAGAMVAVLVVVIVVTVSGVVPRSTTGEAVSDAPTRAQKELDHATTAMADAPAASYSGEIVAGGQSMQVQDLTVTAAGDVHGTVTLDGQPAEVLMIAGGTYLKAGAAFWDAHSAGADRSVRHDSSGAAGNWALVPPDFLGIDLGATLRPASFGLGSQDQDQRIFESDNTTPVPEADQTPDRRVRSTSDPQGLRAGPVESDGQTLVAGDNPVRVNADGSIWGIAGPVRTAPTDRPTTTKLKVTLLTDDEVKSFYSTIQGFSDPLSRVAAPQVDVPKPSGNLDACTNTFCVLEYQFTNSMPGADRGTVTIQQTSSLTVNGAPAGSCARTVTMPMNGAGQSTCTFRFPDPRTRTINYHADSNFDISATAEKDVRVIVESAEKGRDIATAQPGHWYPGGYKADPVARRFNQQIAGVPSGFGYLVGDVPFDGRDADGTLLMTAAPGYDDHVRGGSFDPSWAGTQQVAEQAKKAKAAAGDQPVRWVFAEQNSANAMSKLLADNQISGIDVATVPASS
ncbi:hypothetical protein GTV32_15235 [Gordonia sp. SID5947]|uniref:Tox-REase-5 domain-containing protein n=1 Tax=Gordonia sp. SID5947 TaxID=2690315 RepID=UPI00136EB217|nr:Tox-REase-5 domain-containing protein [Gordonia sp. SID5947]MYR07574.1 hypothetical protein [Gordonia sp. SID5947]